MDRVLDVTVDPTPDAHGDLAGEAHIIGDITDITCTTEALQSSKAYLQAVLDSVGDALFVDDADTGQIIDVNRRCCEMYGYAHEEMLRTPIGALSQGRPPYSQAEALEWLRKTREEGPQVFEWLAKRKNGDLLWVEVSTRHVVIDGTHRFVVAVRDINERKEVLEALRLSEERRRLAMAVANDGLWDWDLTTNDVYFDPRYYLMAGYEVDEFPHRLEEFQTRTHPDDLGYVMAEAEKHLRGESDRFEVEFRFRTRSGDYMWILGMGQIVARDEQGRPMRFVGTHSDITTRMEMEEQLRRTNAFLDSIIENIPDMIFIKDAKELRFVRFNRAGEELLGQSREGLLGKNDYDFFPLEQADHFVSIDRRVLQGKTVVDIPDEAIETSRKGRRILHTKKVPVLNEQGEPDYLLGISEDITERRQAEEDLRRAEERFRAIALNTPDHIIIQDRELRYVFVVNHQLGLTDEDMIGKTDRELTGIAADDTEKLTAVKMKVLETGNPYHFEASNGRDLAANLMSILPDLRCLFTSGYTADVIAHHVVLDEGMHFLEKPFSKNDLAAKIREALGPA